MMKMFVIGIDSATFSIINVLRRKGMLPTLDTLINEGVSAPLTSTMPPVTPPAWVSFMTGVNPGKHGVFDFYAPPSYGYERPVLNAHFIKAKTLWRIISDHEKMVGIINVPMTHPPERVKGFIIPGMQYGYDGPDFAYPPSIMQEIKKNIGNYRVVYGDLQGLYTDNLDTLIREWDDILEIRKKTTLYLMDRYEWDFFMVVFYVLDVIQHHFWKFYDPTHPRHRNSRYRDVIPYFYKKVDSVIGEIIKHLDRETTILILSDHGAGPEKLSFFINSFLAREGFLSFKRVLIPLWKFRWPHLFYKGIRRMGFRGVSWVVPLSHLKTLGRAIDPREGLNISYFIRWDKTRAYAGNHTEQGIYINLRGREEEGIVEPGREYETLRDEIISRLSTIDGLDLKIYKKEDIYTGKYTSYAPDIILKINDGDCIMQKEFYHKDLIGHAYKTSGTHRENGIFIAYGKPLKRGVRITNPHIMDMAPTILYTIGLPVPEDMDGRILIECFKDDFIKENPVRVDKTPAKMVDKHGEGVYSSEDSEKMKSTLRSLGYFD
jgi:predicted AlkP superfamily phosphohydrolase/phosphomutase